MIETIRLYESGSHDPYYNLAVEQRLLETVGEGACILYLWQNQNTVVIGKNQNAWKECRSSLLYEEGGKLARRLSGGGAVFHDLGNLNFTFLVRQQDYDQDRQLSVIEDAVRSLGVDALRSGRNDILAEGKKFSGNAFYKNGVQAYHHGTLLVDVDMEKLSRYLSPSKAKLAAKGVDSVRSRVVNLRQLVPGLTMDILMDALERSFTVCYGAEPERITEADVDAAAVEALRQRNASWEWLYGRKLTFDWTAEERFDWGVVELSIRVESGVVRQTQVHTDAMDCFLAPRLRDAFQNCRFDRDSLIACLRGLPWEADLTELLNRMEI